MSAVSRNLRIREIYDIELLEIKERKALLRVKCESGTYIRKLCHDIGLVLGHGAHMGDLRRTKSYPFDDSGLTKLHELVDAMEIWREEGNVKILDVGEWWDKTTNGLPVPLGINVMRTDLGMDTICKFDKYLQASIEFGLEHMEDALEYAMQYARGKQRDLIEKFVKMYVNEVTVNMGDSGEESIRKLFEMAKEKDLVPDFEISIATK